MVVQTEAVKLLYESRQNSNSIQGNSIIESLGLLAAMINRFPAYNIGLRRLSSGNKFKLIFYIPIFLFTFTSLKHLIL